MAPSDEHGNLKHIIAVLVEFLAEELDIDIQGGGSTTFRRQALARGFEPDECFYIQHAELVRGKKQIDGQGQGVALLGAPRMQREIPSAAGFFTTSENGVTSHGGLHHRPPHRARRSGLSISMSTPARA